jgi:hypothetical protein
MTLFLTSSPSGCPFEPGPDIPVLDTRNHFVANLRAVWPDHAVLGLAIAADPYAYEQNDEMCRVFAQSFANAHLPLTARSLFCRSRRGKKSCAITFCASRSA